jgi:hypothetical protein
MQRATIAASSDLLRSGLGCIAGQLGYDADERVKCVLSIRNPVKYRVDELNR